MSAAPASNDASTQEVGPAPKKKVPYWDGRFVITNVILLLIAGIAAYLEFKTYPAIMTGYPFYETNINLHLAPFTFAYNATRCVRATPTTVASCILSGGTLQSIRGIPALDFFQLFVAIIILANIYHLFTWSRNEN